MLFERFQKSVFEWEWHCSRFDEKSIAIFGVFCVMFGRIEILHYLCDERVELIHERFDDPTFPTILHFAADCGSPEAIRALICVSTN